jgi:Uncharacterized conserved protein
MSVPVRALPVVATVLALSLAATACANTLPSALPPASPAMPGQPAGTVVLAAGNDVGQVVQRVRDAVTAGGGTVTTVLDLGADARGVGVEIPPTTVVVGGPPAALAPLVRVDQRAAANVPQHYLVRQLPDGPVTLTANSADYVAAVSGVAVPDARTALGNATTGVVEQVTSKPAPLGSPLVGVTPAKYILSVFGSATVPVTVDRLRRNADRAPSRTVAVVDMTVGSADTGPPLRPTSLVLVSTPQAEAPLLAMAPSFGIELPMRYVVWLDDQNRTLIGYPDVRRLAARHGIRPDDPAVARMAADADRLARLAAGVIQ